MNPNLNADHGDYRLVLATLNGSDRAKVLSRMFSGTQVAHVYYSDAKDAVDDLLKLARLIPAKDKANAVLMVVDRDDGDVVYGPLVV
jgi:hypothetical protein